MHSANSLPTPAINPALALARFTHELNYAALPEAVRQKSTHHILDALGLGFAARSFPFARPALAGFQAAGSAGIATVLGAGMQRLAPRDAALANGYLMHGLDFDDTHPGAIVHPTVACLPTALAIGESLDASWGEVLSAYAAGMETAIRLGRAVKGGFHHVGFHATGVLSHFSSAVVAGKLLGLSPAQLISAQGIAASTASGVQVFLENGAWTKRMHPGWGALAGITAAHMAAAGFHGPDRPYEGKFGLFDAFLQGRAAEVDADSIAVGLGEQWTLLDTSIKPYPVCHFIHGAAEAALRLRAQVPDLNAITRIVCELPAQTLPIVAEPAAAKRLPRSDYEGKFSAHFVVAACLLRGRFTLAELDDACLADPAILALAARIECRPQQSTAFPRYFSGALTIERADGSSLHEHVPMNLGSGERALTLSDIVAKFRANAALTRSPAQVQTLLDTLLSATTDTPVRRITQALA